jgi:crotonobetainyl-CoA:carnitine CoA-transferase CaiB-like acyl-CoA transferase
MAPHGVYPAEGEDRWVSIAVASDAEWRAFAAIIGSDPGDARFAAAADRHANRAVLDEIVSAWTATLSADDAARRLQAAGIAAHASWTTPEIAADPHLRERHAIVEVREPDGTRRAAVGVPMLLSKGPEIGIHRGTPKLGEDEDYVYGELLRMTREERQALEEGEVIY